MYRVGFHRENEMTTHYGHLWRQIFFAEGGPQLSDNLSLLFLLNLLQGIFTDHELPDLCVLVDVKNTLGQQSTISQDDFDHLKYFSHQLNRKKFLSLSI